MDKASMLKKAELAKNAAIQEKVAEEMQKSLSAKQEVMAANKCLLQVEPELKVLQDSKKETMDHSQKENEALRALLEENQKKGDAMQTENKQMIEEERVGVSRVEKIKANKALYLPLLSSPPSFAAGLIVVFALLCVPLWECCRLRAFENPTNCHSCACAWWRECWHQDHGDSRKS
jgi:hypothetical protein